MRSALYVGRVMHHRVTDPQHRFRYRVYYHLLDLDELATIEQSVWLFGHRRRRPVRFLDADHLGDRSRSTSDNLRAYLRDSGVTDRVDRVLLLTQCRVFGFVFNPVSFYYCYGEEGDGRAPLVAVVAEVHNTFGERHCYLLRGDGRGRGIQRREKKVFHVSPFMTLDGTYAFEVGDPAEDLHIRIDLSRGGQQVFTSHLALTRQPLTGRSLAGMLLRFPLMPQVMLGAIHRQAFSLWRKGLRYHPKPPYDPEAARGGQA